MKLLYDRRTGPWFALMWFLLSWIPLRWFPPRFSAKVVSNEVVFTKVVTDNEYPLGWFLVRCVSTKVVSPKVGSLSGAVTTVSAISGPTIFCSVL